jgi:hypothetical protein
VTKQGNCICRTTAPNLPIVPISPPKQALRRESDKANKIKCNREYDLCLCAETERTWLEDGAFVDFTKEFVYLGSIASYDLTDKPTLERKYPKHHKQWEPSQTSGRNPYIELKTKH